MPVPNGNVRKQERLAKPTARRQIPARDLVLRAERLDHLEASKSTIWKNDLRLSELAYFALLTPALGAMWWSAWSWSMCLMASIYSIVGMLAFSTWMVPRERRLIKHMMFLARYRRRCIDCRYVVQDSPRGQCPECGKAFDPNDQRHLMLPLINQLYSQQARRIATVAIPMILVEITLIARSAPLAGHAWAAAGFLVAFHAIFGLTWWGARKSDEVMKGIAEGNRPFQQWQLIERGAIASFSPMHNTTKSDSVHAVSPTATRLQAPWSALRGKLRPECFTSLLKLQYTGLLLRWVFLVALCGGLAAILRLDPATLKSLGIATTPLGLYGGIGVPALVWMALVIFGHRQLMLGLHGRMRRLLLT